MTAATLFGDRLEPLQWVGVIVVVVAVGALSVRSATAATVTSGETRRSATAAE